MAFDSLHQFIERLEKEGELIRISQNVDPELEITEITDRISKQENGGKALYFENTGTEFPVLINAMGSEKRMKIALDVDDLDDIGNELEHLLVDLSSPKNSIIDKLRMLPKLSGIASWMPKLIKGRGKCQEVTHHHPDLSQLPVLKCWPEDGGPFVTLPMVITKDPVTGVRNVGMYRMQIFDKNLTGMHWHKHKVGARHFSEYKKAGKKMPVAVALGGDPAYTYAATAPVPDNIDEFLLAGFLRKKSVELVKCITQDIEVPKDADIIIEGYIDPEEEFIWEGPFGDHTGFYSLADWYPRFHVTCITHRRGAVYPATIVGIPPMEDAWIGKATERIFLTPIKMALLPEVIDYDLPFAGVAHNLALVKINKTYPGQALKVMNALWGAGQMMFNKMMIVVDQNVDIHQYPLLIHTILENFIPASDIHFMRGPLDVLDHSSSKMAFGSKMGVDATSKFEEEIPENQPAIDDPDALINLDLLKEEFIEIVDANLYPAKRFNVLILSVKKKDKTHIETLVKKLYHSQGFNQIKLCVFVDERVDVTDWNLVLWIALGNIDPKRDSIIVSKKNYSGSCIFIDATRKSKQKDQFQRDWPNIVSSSMSTIKKVDEKWKTYQIGKFIPSPSLKYQKMLFNGGAIAGEDMKSNLN
ncbi:MAG: menaquinone biosynthesis decarboxylase [Bacteroidales bacterium]|jgi:4-hydroxy-3-polyprenylbenzoate decarboxylase|nr:menaquinone biosynthesis decarboxylase [Bacteroidales bacterium]